MERSAMREEIHVSRRSLALAKATAAVMARAGPILWQEPRTNIAVEGRIRPVAHAADQTMFYRVEVDIVHMPREILFVANGVLPESALPDRILPFPVALCHRTGRSRRPCEETFDPPPSAGKISVMGGQRHDRVYVIGQDHNRINGKRALGPRHSK